MIPGLAVCQGSKEATYGGYVDIFKGVPYAKPPVGALRFQPTQPKTWTRVFNATRFGHKCAQVDMFTKITSGSEDCLTLNIYRPSKASGNLTVMVWIHGGGYIGGEGKADDASILSRVENVLVVTINYRLGDLGFFNVPGTEAKGNYGLLDQIAALRWVKKNIASFGGNPNKITIFGERAGGASVSLLSVSPLIKNEGLFIRAIAQSGVASSPWAAYDVTDEQQAIFFGTKVGCPLKGASLVKCLKGKPQNEILQAQANTYERIWALRTPTVDKHVLSDLPVKLQAGGN